MHDSSPTCLGRRAFLANGSIVLAAGLDLVPSISIRADDPPSGRVRFGLVTDLHYADKPPAGTRHYGESLDKLAEAAERFRKEKIDFAVQLGDLIDAADAVETELAYLKRIFHLTLGHVGWRVIWSGDAAESTTRAATVSRSRTTRVPNDRCPFEVAAKTGMTAPQIALNWLLRWPTISTIIIGARDEGQLRDTLGSVGRSLSGEQVARLDAVSAVTLPYPYWHQRRFAERNPPLVA